jgi:hypothetical protein
MDEDICKRLYTATLSLIEEFERDEGPLPLVRRYRELNGSPACTVGHIMHRADVKNFFDIPSVLHTAFGKVEEVNDNSPTHLRRKNVVPHLRKLLEKLGE